MKKLSLTFDCPVTGQAAPVEECADSCFSRGLAGDGVVIRPVDGRVYAPADARVVLSDKARHLLGLRTEQGLELLLHVGLGTGAARDEGFRSLVVSGARVRRGECLLQFDPAAIAGAGDDPSVVFTFCSLKQQGGNLTLCKSGEVQAGEALIQVNLPIAG